MKYSHVEHFRKTLLTAGLSGEIYQSVKPLIHEENARIMQRLASIGFLFGCAMTALSLVNIVSRHVLPAYLTLMAVSLLSLYVLNHYRRQNKVPPMPFFYIQMAAILAYGIMNSAFFAPGPETMGVTVIVLITLVPFLLIDVPWRECILIIAAGVIYLAGVYLCKSPSIRSIETTNTICFTLVACMSSYVFTTRTIQSMADKLYIEKERDTDELTGLSSRHAGSLLMRAQLLREIQGVFIIMDIDKFKDANDHYGHPYGDHVLKLMGLAVRANISRKDIACRYGGDEFCILLTDCHMDEGQEFVRKIQDFIQQQQINEPMKLTCSFGLAETSRSEELDHLLARADQALYQAKARGRNQSVQAD